jgi:uncharacterized membrane protein (UPF0127 family)
MLSKTPVAAAKKIVSARRFSLIESVELILALLAAAILTYYVFLDNGRVLILPNGKRLNLEVRDDEIGRVQGLSGRSSLSESSAMLFVFDIESDRYCFWMKDMKFDIDILWLDSKKRIVDAKYAASPSSYPEEFCPKSAARYVLELPAGQALKNGLIIGVQTKF